MATGVRYDALLYNQTTKIQESGQVKFKYSEMSPPVDVATLRNAVHVSASALFMVIIGNEWSCCWVTTTYT